jgi:hypothetical protein
MLKKSVYLFSGSVSAALFIAFFVCVHKIDAYENFMYARSKIASAARLACGIESTYGPLSANEKTAILRIPSVNSAGIIMPDSFDRCVIMLSDNILLFSVVPAASSGRKHKTLYYRNFPPCVLNSSGNMLEFSCRIRGIDFQNYSSVSPDFLPVSDRETEVFR